MVGLIYTANFGGYDKKRSFGEPEKGIVYRVFSEDYGTKNPLFKARNVKVMAPHLYPNCDWYLWLDATMQIKKPVLPLIEKLLESEHDFAAFKHNEWDCAYREIDACMERKKDTGANLTKAHVLLLNANFPKNFGHPATGVLFRKNTAKVKNHALAWWLDMQFSTMRDQCTFMLNLWQMESYIEWIPGLHTKNQWIDYRRGHVG